jgi:hypothetical protein
MSPKREQLPKTGVDRFQWTLHHLGRRCRRFESCHPDHLALHDKGHDGLRRLLSRGGYGVDADFRLLGRLVG